MHDVKITKAIVVTTGGADTVFLETNLPSPLHPHTGCLDLAFKAAKGTGALYVKAHFGMEPEIVTHIGKPEPIIIPQSDS